MPKAAFQPAPIQEQGVHVEADMQESVWQAGIMQKDRRDEPPELTGPDQVIDLFTEDRGNIRLCRKGRSISRKGPAMN